ncbi:DUF4199 domain-containing protein [Chitinophaga sp. Cy-1792]|uniref:DUF4199 domain-containing protein n=1 Tax=Chitinophaga sp. Cy-1792 TaxID=2608339 RepID=UPI001420BE3C|nr:DUF4199 domain-containing protein [Chitinophaga sp. Cy-1792]NIG54334.1 DUF4199 domain-containing protein [Chitinophaga sp. Cy-1792]
MEKKHVKYGLITALVIIVLSLILVILHLDTQSWAKMIGMPILLIGVIVSCIAYAKQDKTATFGTIFATGFRTAVVVALITVMGTALVYIVNPAAREHNLELARQDMIAQHMSQSQIDEQLEMNRKSFFPVMIGTGIFYPLVFGAVFALVGAAVASRKK